MDEDEAFWPIKAWIADLERQLNEKDEILKRANDEKIYIFTKERIRARQKSTFIEQLQATVLEKEQIIEARDNARNKVSEEVVLLKKTIASQELIIAANDCHIRVKNQNFTNKTEIIAKKSLVFPSAQPNTFPCLGDITVLELADISELEKSLVFKNRELQLNVEGQAVNGDLRSLSRSF